MKKSAKCAFCALLLEISPHLAFLCEAFCSPALRHILPTSVMNGAKDVPALLDGREWREFPAQEVSR